MFWFSSCISSTTTTVSPVDEHQQKQEQLNHKNEFQQKRDQLNLELRKNLVVNSLVYKSDEKSYDECRTHLQSFKTIHACSIKLLGLSSHDATITKKELENLSKLPPDKRDDHKLTQTKNTYNEINRLRTKWLGALNKSEKETSELHKHLSRSFPPGFSRRLKDRLKKEAPDLCDFYITYTPKKSSRRHDHKHQPHATAASAATAHLPVLTTTAPTLPVLPVAAVAAATIVTTPRQMQMASPRLSPAALTRATLGAAALENANAATLHGIHNIALLIAGSFPPPAAKTSSAATAFDIEVLMFTLKNLNQDLAVKMKRLESAADKHAISSAYQDVLANTNKTLELCKKYKPQLPQLETTEAETRQLQKNIMDEMTTRTTNAPSAAAATNPAPAATINSSPAATAAKSTNTPRI
jgi:hypothetical protein